MLRALWVVATYVLKFKTQWLRLAFYKRQVKEAIGWNDIHYKLYLATCGESGPGKPAGKTRQRADWRNFSIDVPRPEAVAEYAANMGNVDLHKRFRLGMLGLHKV